MTKFEDELIRDVTNKETGLTEQEEYFLNILFDRCSGDIQYAMKEAGYPKDASAIQLSKKLSKQIRDRSKDYLTAATAKASSQLVKIFEDPSAMGAKNIISAAKEILDRGGVNNEQEIKLPDNAIVILPPKNKQDD